MEMEGWRQCEGRGGGMIREEGGENCVNRPNLWGGEIENSPKKIKNRMHLTSLNKGRMLAICSKAIS